MNSQEREDELAQLLAEKTRECQVLTDAMATTHHPEVRRNDDGTLDEVVGHGFFHLEQLDETTWFLDLGGARFHLVCHGRVEPYEVLP